MKDKLAQIQSRFEELERLLQDEAVISDVSKMKEASQEYDELKEIMSTKKELDIAIAKTKEVVKRLRKISGNVLADFQ